MRCLTRPMLLGLLVLVMPGIASALSMAPVAITHSSGATGTITLVSDTTGNPGTQLSGTTAGGDTTLVFAVSLSAGSVDEIGVGVFPPPTSSSGSGWIPGGGLDVTAGATNTGSQRTFQFDPGGNGALDAGEVVDNFFVSFASVSAGSSVNFMVLVGATAETFSGTLVDVPEPALAGLLVLGLAGLGMRRRR